MELSEELGQFKSEFAKQIAVEVEKAKNMNILLVKGQHFLKRGTSESVLGKWKKKPFKHSSAFNSSKFHGSVGSLPSLEQFQDILER